MKNLALMAGFNAILMTRDSGLLFWATLYVARPLNNYNGLFITQPFEFRPPSPW